MCLSVSHCLQARAQDTQTPFTCSRGVPTFLSRLTPVIYLQTLSRLSSSVSTLPRHNRAPSWRFMYYAVIISDLFVNFACAMLRPHLLTTLYSPALIWSSFYVIIFTICTCRGIHYLFLKRKYHPQPPIDNDLALVIDTAIEQVKITNPRIIKPVLSADKPKAQRNPLMRSKDWTGSPTRHNNFSSSVPAIRRLATVTERSATPPPITSATENKTGRVTTPVYQTSFVIKLHKQDFSILEREAPESFRTLQKAGMFDENGTPTKKLLEDKTTPWGRNEMLLVDEKKKAREEQQMVMMDRDCSDEHENED